MPKKNLPSYRLHKPTGQAICVLRGKTFYLGKHKSKESRAKYNELIAEYLANDCKLPPTRSRNEITVEELALRFLEWADGYYLDKNGNSTEHAEHCRRAVAPLVRHYGRNTVSEFGPLSLKFIRERLIEENLVEQQLGKPLKT